MRGWKSFTYAPTCAHESRWGSRVTKTGMTSGSDPEADFFSADRDGGEQRRERQKPVTRLAALGNERHVYTLL